MSKEIDRKARPEGGWSLAVVTDVTRELHERFAAVCDGIDTATIMLAARKANGQVSKQSTNMDDGYEPFATVEFRAGATLGDVLIVLPWCTDFARVDGDMCDRAVSVHTMDHVPDSAADRVVRQFIDALPEPKIPPAPEGECDEAA